MSHVKGRARKSGKGAHKKGAMKSKAKGARAGKKAGRQPKVYPPEVIQACKRYGAASEKVGKVEGTVEQAKWARAAEAHGVMVAAKKYKVPYIAAASKLCKVARSVVTMDCQAELMRQALNVAPAELPKDSVSVFYELHRAKEAAIFAAGENEEAKAAAQEKVKTVGKSLIAGELSVRGIREEFADEFKKLRQARKKARKAKGKDTAAEALTSVLADAKGLKSLIDKWVSARDGDMPVIKITATKPTAKAIATKLASKAFRDALDEACAADGPLWILVDRGQVSATVERIGAAADKKKSAA